MRNFYQQARFNLSAPNLRSCPPDDGLEIVFAGRSNAGKSSALNAICEQKKLAKVSKTPGRTRHLVFFDLDAPYRFVDLPGYGYARVPLALKKQWHHMMDDFFRHRRSLCGVVLIMDIRHPLQPFDQQMIAWANTANLNCHILLTKADKLSYSKAKSTLLTMQKKCAYSGMSMQLFSSTKKQGLDEARQTLDAMFERPDNK